MNDRIREVVVVEGRNDSSAVKRAVDAQTIETHGFGISRETWEAIEKAYDERGIIVLTDPDFSGEEIRRKLTMRFPKARHAYLTAGEASKGGDVGVENADAGAIRHAIFKAHATVEEKRQELFSLRDMQAAGLAGETFSAERRAKVGGILGIGYGNVKAFRNKLNRYGITLEELNEAILACGDCGNKG